MKSKNKILELKINAMEQTIQMLQRKMDTETWLDSADVKMKFHISDSTLSRYRKRKLVPYTKLGNKYLYPESFFNKSLKQKIVNSHLL